MALLLWSALLLFSGPVPPEKLDSALAELNDFHAMPELTRLEHQPHAPFKAVDLSRIVTDAVELAEPIFEQNGQSLTVDIPEPAVRRGQQPDLSSLFQSAGDCGKVCRERRDRRGGPDRSVASGARQRAGDS